MNRISLPMFSKPRNTSFVFVLFFGSLALSTLLVDLLPLSVNVFHVFFGIPLFLLCLRYSLQRMKSGGFATILLTAPLLRQAIFVLLPAIMLEATDTAAIGPLSLDTVRDGALILTIENYVLFIMIAFLLPKRQAAIHTREWPTKPLLFVAIGLMVVGYGIQLANINVNSEAVDAPVGASLTQWWGPVGLALFIIWANTAHGKMHFFRILLVIVATVAVALPYLGTGGRVYVIQPLATAGIAYLLCHPRKWTMRHILISSGAAIGLFMLISAATYWIRLDYYLSGQRASLSDLHQSAFAGGYDYLESPMHRLGGMIASSQFLHDTGIGSRTWANAAGLLISSPISSRIIDLSAITGLDYRIEGLSPGAYLARQFGATGGFSFPLSADFYLFGGYLGVVLGAMIVGCLVSIIAHILIMIFNDSRFAAALVAGEIYLSIFAGETGEYIITALMWKLAVITMILFVYERACLAILFKPAYVNKNTLISKYY